MGSVASRCERTSEGRSERSEDEEKHVRAIPTFRPFIFDNPLETIGYFFAFLPQN
ncbi:MAG: hypothetical protein IJO11_01970 [Alphaproteobacteria bacterium]|nr:hypothetical protein [Alphaproteobacteria bacterium]